MLKTVQLTNFKAHRDVVVDLSPVTVLVGPNGCGKSTVLEALSCIGQMAGGSPPGVVFSGARALSEVRSAGTTGPVALKATGTLGGSAFECSWNPDDGTNSPFALHWTDGTRTPITTLDDILAPDQRLVRDLGAVVWRRFDPRELARPESSDDVEPQVTDFGFGLASFLSHMKLNQDEAFHQLVQALREIVPGVLAIRFDRVPLPEPPTTTATILDRRASRTGHRILFDTVQGAGIPAHRASKGVLLTLGLLATLFGASAPRLVLLEEPGCALHPCAFVDFVSHLRRLMTGRPDLQIVMASHSPYLVSAFEPTEIQLFSVSPEGRTICVRMDRHPDFDKWREAMVPGELWMAIDRRRRATA